MTLRELLKFLSEPRNKAFYLNKQGLPMYLVVNPLMKRNEFFVYDKSYKKIWLGMLSHFIVNHEIIPSYMLDKKRYDATIDIDLIESTHWQVFKKQISFEAVFEEKGGF
ncbi:Uma2 family endonuclease, partial [Campylobacter jejuni]|nr:Uma2 family endonuclease [Campylobacter jejuni]